MLLDGGGGGPAPKGPVQGPRAPGSKPLKPTPAPPSSSRVPSFEEFRGQLAGPAPVQDGVREAAGLNQQFLESLRTDKDSVVPEPQAEQGVPEGLFTTTAVPGPGGMMINIPATRPGAIENMIKAERGRVLDSGLKDPEQPEAKPQRGEVKRLTWEEYQAMGPRQRAAVDFNTMLVKAVRKDRRLQEWYGRNVSEEERAAYEGEVESRFGADGGSKKYAPETLAVLEQIDYSDTSADLDDFLSLRSAITSDDIKLIPRKPETVSREVSLDNPFGSGTLARQRVTEEVGYKGLTPDQVGRLEITKDIAEKTLEKSRELMAQAMEKGNSLLHSAVAVAEVDRNKALSFYGGAPNEASPRLGYGTPEFTESGEANDWDSYFQQAFDTLADSAGKVSNPAKAGAFLDAIRSDMSHPGVWESFLAYADSRSRNAELYRTNLGPDRPEVKYRTPEEFRELLGLQK